MDAKMLMPLALLPLFCLAAFGLYIVVLSAPTIREDELVSLKFPSTINELKTLTELLGKYSVSNRSYVVLLFSSAYLFKQAFAIPGSVLMNILAGAIFGVKLGLPFCCVLTAVGATFSYCLSLIFLKQLVQRNFQVKLERMQEKIDSNGDRLFFFLLSLRFFPVTPNWLINILSPIVGIPIHLFFITVLLGLIPYNYLCVQSGSMLASLNSLSDVVSMQSALQLGGIALVTLATGFIRKK